MDVDDCGPWREVNMLSEYASLDRYEVLKKEKKSFALDIYTFLVFF